MLRRLMLAFSLALCFASPSCQSYNAGLQKTVTGADETAAISALHAVAVAQQTYGITNGGEYGTFQQLSDGGLLDARYGGSKPVKDYILTMNVIPKSSGAPEGSYTCNADPDNNGSAVRHFYIDSTSTAIHVNASQPATAQDPTAQ
jgi:hypothetical protein